MSLDVFVCPYSRKPEENQVALREFRPPPCRTPTSLAHPKPRLSPCTLSGPHCFHSKTYAFPTLFPLIVAALNPNSNAYLSVAAWTHTKTYQHWRKWRIEKKINLEEKAERFNILMVASEKKITLEVKKTNLKERKVELAFPSEDAKCCPRGWMS